MLVNIHILLGHKVKNFSIKIAQFLKVHFTFDFNLTKKINNKNTTTSTADIIKPENLQNLQKQLTSTSNVSKTELSQ